MNVSGLMYILRNRLFISVSVMRSVLYPVAFFVFLFCASIGSINSSVAEAGELMVAAGGSSHEDSIYSHLVDQAKTIDPQLNYQKLRLAYTTTSRYAPYSRQRTDLAAQIKSAIEAQQYDECLATAGTLLDQEYVSLFGHFAAMLCNRMSGRRDQADFHKKMLDRLVESIVRSGDGMSPETAYVVISSEETHTFLRFAGFETRSQGFVEIGDKSFDLMEVIDRKTGKKQTIYFNVSIPMNKSTATGKPLSLFDRF